MLRYPHSSTPHGQAERGDTLIEVILAITIFAMIIITALTMMNQGTAASQRALEITLARQSVDAQADTLRFLQTAYIDKYYSGITFNTTDNLTSPAEEYYKIIQQVKSTASASTFGTVPCGTPPQNSFVLNTHTAQMVNTMALFANYPATFAQQFYNGANLTRSEGLWVEGIRTDPPKPPAPNSNAGYIDFHIRACWDTVGSTQPMNIGTIVRLYEPRG
jgi:type II secretory pathway pseudopilin PulG